MEVDRLQTPPACKKGTTGHRGDPSPEEKERTFKKIKLYQNIITEWGDAEL